MTKKAAPKKVVRKKMRVTAIPKPTPALAKLEQQVREMQVGLRKQYLGINIRVSEIVISNLTLGQRMEKIEAEQAKAVLDLTPAVLHVYGKHLEELNAKHEADMKALTASLHELEVRLTADMQSTERSWWILWNAADQQSRIDALEERNRQSDAKRPWWKFWRRKV